MGENYFFNNNNQIILYGVNQYSLKLSQVLKLHNYEIIAYFDMRYKELNLIDDTPVYGLNDNPFQNVSKEHIVLIIMLQNALQHDRIVKDAINQGFHKIIFLPMSSVFNKNLADKMRYNYNKLLAGQFDKIDKLPLVNIEMFEQKMSDKDTVIKREGNQLIVWMPIELIYSNPKDKLNNDSKLLRYADVPIAAYYPYMQLFYFLKGKKVNSEQYLDEYGKNSCHYKNNFTDADIIKQRSELYLVYKRELNEGMDFFKSSAPVARYNLRGYFNLLEGQHRCVFLIQEQFSYIPIRISITDYTIWKSKNNAKILMDYLKLVNVNELIMPLENPYFKKINSRFQLIGSESLICLQEFLGSNMMKNCSVLEFTDFQGYYSRNAVRMNAESIHLCELGPSSITDSILKLFHMNKLISRVSYQEVIKKTYDIVVLSDTVYSKINDKERNSLNEHLMTMVNKYLFYFSFENQDRYFDIRNDLCKYNYFKTFIIDGKQCEFGVYCFSEEKDE